MKNKRTEKSIGDLTDAAFKQAARKVLKRAEETNTPLILWEDGAVKAVHPRDLPEAIRRNLAEDVDADA